MSERLGEVDYLDVLNQPSGEPELAAQASKKRKAKRSAKQIAAAKRNLRLAHMKRRAKKKGRHKVKTFTHMPNKRRGGVARTYDRKGNLIAKKRVASAKQRAAAKRNIKKAQAALKAKRHGKGKTHRLTPRRRARSTSAHTEAKTMKKGKGKRKAHRTAAQKAAAKKNIKKAQAAVRRKGRKSGKRKTLAKRSAHRTAVAPPKPRKAMRRTGKSRKRRFTKKARDAAMRNLRKARAARKRAKAAGRKHNVRAYSYHSKPKRVRVPAHRSYERKHRQSRKARAASLRNLKKARAALRHGGRRRSGHRARETYMEAMVNALTGVEVVFGGISGIVWFMVTDFVDRVLATHALTDKGTKDASGHELYADNPPTTGSYAGLFNATAICAPMDVTRWLVGALVMTALPLGISFAIPNDIVRSCFQAAAGGAGIRIFGKAAIDLVAYITMWNPIGQQLYDGEMRAQVYASGNTDPLASLPSSGLGKVDKPAGTGEAPAKEEKPGTGWPSMPRERADAHSTSGTASEGGAPPPPAPTPRTGPQAGEPGYLAGLPPKRPGLYDWANREERDQVAA